MADDDSYFRLRIPAKLKVEIAEAAQQAGRSMNAEIIQRLVVSFDLEANRIATLVDEHESAFGLIDDRLDDLEKDVGRLLEQAGLLYDRR